MTRLNDKNHLLQSNEIITDKTSSFQRAHTKRARTRRIFSIMAAVVVFFTTYALVLPALTVTAQPYCGNTEHTHELACYSNPHADVETAVDWEATLPSEGDLTGVPAEDLLAVAKSQIGYLESEENYIVDEDGKTKIGYNRYGEWNDEPYADWSMDFVAFCLNYSGIEIPADTTEQENWIDALDEAGLLKDVSEEEFAVGDIVFLESEEVGSRDVPHMGIVSFVDTKEIILIEGDRSKGRLADGVMEQGYRKDSSRILAVAGLPEDMETVEAEQMVADEAEPDVAENADTSDHTLTYTGEGYVITATYADGEAFEPGTELVVSEIHEDGKTAEQKEFRKYYEQAEDTLSSDISSARFFDISFECEGETVEPAGDVNVTITLDQPVEGAATAIHLPEGEDAEVMDASTDGNDISFTASSFSVYGVIYTVDFHWNADGKTFDFSIPGGSTIMISELVSALGIGADDSEDEMTSEKVWTFVENIQNVEFSNPEYVSVSKTEEGDWTLTSLMPFDTEETLTITMKNGDVITIKVTDANQNARKASLISAANIQNGQDLVIYQKVVQSDDTVLYYAVDGNGNLQRVYNSSDSVYWLNDLPIVWKIEELKDGSGNPTGYYTLYNEATGKYLVPKNDNEGYRVVHSLSDFSDGDTKHLNISLPGKEAGQYLSKIASWDYDANVTYGMEVLSATDIHAKELLSSQNFYFAVPDEIVQGRLTEVDTVDSRSMGIKITMFDFEGNEWQKDPRPRLSFMTRTIGDSTYLENIYSPGLVKPVLGSDGFPVSTETNQSIRPVFETQGNYYSTSSNSWDTPGTFNYTVNRTDNVNHLFLQSVYDATGYFYYSCFENYAQLVGSDFKVYEQLGTPWFSDEFFFKRGNFTPYNEIDLTHILSNETSGSSSSPLAPDDPRKGEDLYAIVGAENEDAPGADYFFGMIMEADFIQGPGGYNDRDEPTVYEFNGDDDLWIYIDNVLVLDIGGVHDAFQGKIDFKTGDVTVTNGTETTIKQMFKNANLFPDGTPWVESRVNEYFEGNTFKDYSTHSFKMFYMERGAAASNLEMKFNLMPVQGSSFRVTKQMPETASHDIIQNDYADAIFYYRAYIGNNVCTRQAFGSTAKYTDGTPVIWKDNTTFQLKHGQTAIFPVDSNTVRYHVEEVEPESGSSMLDHYDVTNTDPAPGQAPGSETVTAEKSVSQRGEVVYTNRPHDDIVNELQIVKELTGGMYTDEQGNLLVNEETGSPYFEYRIYLENTAGKMVYYALGEYYQIDIDGNYVYYERGERKTAEYRNGKYIYTYNNGTVEELDKPKITEHTSANGSIGDIRHGDTIIIRGLLEGTDFVVDERTDRSLMIKGTEGEDTTDKYSFDGTEVEDAYIRETGENMPDYPTGTLYDPPTPPDAAYSDKAAEGTIIQQADAKVKVKNSSQLINADLTIQKVTQEGEPIEGAVFKLMKGAEIVPVALSGEGVIVEPLVTGETVIIEDNTFTIPAGGVTLRNIPAGKAVYTLVEVSPPPGYIIRDPNIATFEVRSGQIEIKSYADMSTGTEITFEDNALTVPNIPGAALPNTGGPGTGFLVLIGALIAAGAGALLIRRKVLG